MKQTDMFAEKTTDSAEVCVFCHPQPDHRHAVRIVPRVDSQGTRYMTVALPSCKEHENVPVIVLRQPGRLP